MKIKELLEERAVKLGESVQVDASLSNFAVSEAVTDLVPKSPEVYFGAWRNSTFGNGKPRKEGGFELEIPTEIEKNIVIKTEQEEASKESLKKGLSALSGKPLVIHASANEQKHLFEAVSAQTIAAHLKDVVGVEVGDQEITIDAPIKELGEHVVHITAGSETMDVTVLIEAN